MPELEPEFLGSSAAPAAYPALPFALAGSAVPADTYTSPLMARLDLLQQISLETHRQLEHLTRTSSEIMALLAQSPASPRPLGDPGLALTERATISYRLFGSFEVCAAGRTFSAFGGKKARLLLAYLAVEPRRLVPKDVLVEQFWPECALRRGSNNLSIAVYQIRSALKEIVRSECQGISVRQGLYSLEEQLDCWVDVEEFREQIASGRGALHRGDADATRKHVSAAVELYRGDFLESDPYEEWTIEPRHALAESLRWALSWLAADAASHGKWQDVLECGERLVRRDLCDEEGYRRIIEGHWRLGRRSEALNQFSTCRQVLQDELGVPPSEETQALLRELDGGGALLRL